MYRPGVHALLASSCPVRQLLDTILEDRSWWKRQVNGTIKTCLLDLEKWHELNAPPTRIPDAVEPRRTYHVTPDSPFKCPLCDSRFELRKHLGVHLARRHGVVAPARLY